MRMMKEKKTFPKSSASKNRLLKPEDTELWSLATQDVKRLHRKDDKHHAKRSSPPKEHQPKPIKSEPIGRIYLETLKPPITPITSHPPQLDSSLQKRFSQGDVPIDGRIDLHGLNLEQAYQRFMKFIAHHIEQKSRCLLVITGKGNARTGSGIIRKHLPDWCHNPQIKPYILQMTAAQPKHGGDGASYILLKRVRR